MVQPMNENTLALPTAWTDPGDAPELTEAFFEQADGYVDKTFVMNDALREWLKAHPAGH